MQLIGFLDGIEVSFDFYPPNTFKADIPKRTDGVYILELHARDSAGNVAYYNNIFVRIDYLKLEVKMIINNYEINQNGKDFGFRQLYGIYNLKEINESIEDLHIPNYSYRELIM